VKTAHNQNRKRKAISPAKKKKLHRSNMQKLNGNRKKDKPAPFNGHRGHKSKLENLYSNIQLPGSYSGIETTRHYSGKSRRHMIDFLSGQDGYTQHKPIRTKFQRRKVYSKGIADLIQADLVDLSSIARYNDGYLFLLTCLRRELGRFR